MEKNKMYNNKYIIYKLYLINKRKINLKITKII